MSTVKYKRVGSEASHYTPAVSSGARNIADRMRASGEFSEVKVVSECEALRDLRARGLYPPRPTEEV